MHPPFFVHLIIIFRVAQVFWQPAPLDDHTSPFGHCVVVVCGVVVVVFLVVAASITTKQTVQISKMENLSILKNCLNTFN
jgi:hypothetical protein